VIIRSIKHTDSKAREIPQGTAKFIPIHLITNHLQNHTYRVTWGKELLLTTAEWRAEIHIA
jgi:hypothetical protein